MPDPAMPPEVTAVIPTMNRARLVSRALASALRQEDVDLEVIVVDNGSTDETPEILDRVHDGRVRVIRRGKARAASARNLAVDAARAPWVAFLDDDDVWAPRKLRIQLDRTADDVAIVCGGAVFVDKGGVVLSERLPFLADEEYPGALLRENVVGTPSGVIAPKALVQSVGGFDETLPRFEDWDLWIRLAQHGRVVACREVLLAYTVHAATMSAHAGEKPPAHELIRAKYAPALPVDPDPVAHARWVAGHQREGGRRVDAIKTYVSSGLRHGDPGNLLRGVSLVFGERTLRAVRRINKGNPSRPLWLDEALRPHPF
jgi:hypothetical protein